MSVGLRSNKEAMGLEWRYGWGGYVWDLASHGRDLGFL
jgi:hypothetical protein